MQNCKKEPVLILSFIIFTFALFAAVLIITPTREWFSVASTNGGYTYLMAFAKFALLATSGELIAIKMATGSFKKPPYIIARFIIWGLIGIWITYMMKVFFLGTAVLMEKGLLPTSSDETVYLILHAFYTSATMNLTFGPTFMAVHKCSDTYLMLRAKSEDKKVKLSTVIDTVDWKHFVTFTLFKTVPLFWIPAHTLTFMLPAAYQVMLAALLSVALGVILNLKKKAPKKAEESQNKE